MYGYLFSYTTLVHYCSGPPRHILRAIIRGSSSYSASFSASSSTTSFLFNGTSSRANPGFEDLDHNHEGDERGEDDDDDGGDVAEDAHGDHDYTLFILLMISIIPVRNVATAIVMQLLATIMMVVGSSDN